MVSCLAMGEMSPDEQDYALRIAHHPRLVPGGMIVIADQSLPQGGVALLAYWLKRLPLAAVTWLLTQTTTRPVRGLCRRLRAAGFRDATAERMWSGSFLIVHGIKRKS